MLNRLKENKLFLDASKYLSASVLAKGLGFITIPIYTRTFGVENYGEYSLFLVIFSFATLLFEFGSIKALSRTWYDYNENEDRISILIVVLKRQLLINIFFISIIFWFSHTIANFFDFERTTLLIGVLTALFQLPIQFILMYNQLNRNSSTHALISLTTNGFVKIITIISFGVFTFKSTLIYNEAFIRIAFSIIIAFTLFYKSSITKKAKNIESFSFTSFWKSSFILLFHNIATLVLNLSDRLLINKFLGVKETAIYSLIYDVSLLQSLIVSALATSYAPELYENLKKKNYKKISFLNKKILLTFFLISVSIITFSKEIIWFLGGDIYTTDSYLVFLNSFGILIMSIYTLNAQIIFFNKDHFRLAVYSIISALVNIIFNYYFLTKYGIVVASITTIFSYLLLLILTQIDIRFIIKFKTLTSFKDAYISMFLIIFYTLILILIENFSTKFLLYFSIKSVVLVLVFVFVFIYSRRNLFSKA